MFYATARSRPQHSVLDHHETATGKLVETTLSDTYSPRAAREREVSRCFNVVRFQGLTLKEETVRRILYGNNLIDVDVQGVGTIFFKEVLEPFYVFQVFSMIIW